MRPNRMQWPDDWGEIIWMLNRMMSLFIGILATKNKHQILLLGENGQEKQRKYH